MSSKVYKGMVPVRGTSDLPEEDSDMALVRWSPARNLLQMREEMDRLFNQFFGRGGNGEEQTWGQSIWAAG